MNNKFVIGVGVLVLQEAMNGVETPSPKSQEVKTQSLESQGGRASALQKKSNDIDGSKALSPEFRKG